MKKAEKKFLKKLFKSIIEVHEIEVNDPIEVENDKSWTSNLSFGGILQKEDDFMDKPLLSLNDLLESWRINELPDRGNEFYIKSPLFQNFLAKAKSKL